MILWLSEGMCGISSAFNDSYNNLLYTVGLSWFFDYEKSSKVSCSENAAAGFAIAQTPGSVDKDMDSDGVPDALDQCPGTPL